jgi:hypothetical protein
MSEQCQRCGEMGEDRRTLTMSCGYEMNELGLPFTMSGEGWTAAYLLRVCKGCRAEWMAALKGWFGAFEGKKSCGSGIFVRRNGATVEITEEEWRALKPARALTTEEGA